MKCPTCKKDVALGAPEFPFCCERCRLLDLGAWASGKYVIPGPPVNERADSPDEDEN